MFAIICEFGKIGGIGDLGNEGMYVGMLINKFPNTAAFIGICGKKDCRAVFFDNVSAAPLRMIGFKRGENDTVYRVRFFKFQFD